MISAETVIAVSVAAMLGALIGWLAPTAVSLALISAVTLSYYHPPRRLHDPLTAYPPAVRTMQRRW